MCYHGSMTQAIRAKQPTKTQLRKLLKEWENGRSKNDIERKEFGNPVSHGKFITKLWREELGVETEATHPLVTENKRLKKLLADNGIAY